MTTPRLGRRAGGRPPLPPEERRSIKTPILWTSVEAEVIDAALDATGLEFNEWARPILMRAAKRDGAVKR